MATDQQPPAWTGKLRLASIALIVVAVVLLLRALPFGALLDVLKTWIEGLGFWGPAIFAGVYAVWSVLFLPGSALTLAGGAIFGLWVGVAAVLVGATVGAALSFLIARHLARGRVERMAKGNPKFGAIYKAIGEGGWKIVAMLRLSPVMPFNLQNYLYGVTPIGFWPAILTSFVFMAPGTFMYVYFGHIAGQGLAEASGAGAGTSGAEWALRVVGLLATVAVTVYVTKLANKALAEQTQIGGAGEEAAEQAPPPKQNSAAGSLAMAAVAVLLFSSALYAYVERDALLGLFGPPAVESNEAYRANPGGPDFDHSAFNTLLGQFVDGAGLVDYQGLQARQSELDQYIAALAEAPFDAMGRDQKLALLLNAYNAFTLRLILDYYPTNSIRDIPSAERWDAERWSLAGQTLSLNQLEHEQIRPKFAEPRVHFALVCAAIGCPKLRKEAYTAERLEEQLDDQTRYIHANDRWFSFDPKTDVASLTALYDWYGGDFEQAAGSPVAFAARYSSALKSALDAGEDVRVQWLDYDWSLNEQ